MKRWMRCAARLYPASWRARYADEFEALLEDAPLQWADFWDIVRGALTMQLKIGTFAKVAGVCGLAGLAVAAVYAVRTPSIYRSTAVLKMEAIQPDDDLTDRLSNAEQEILSRSSLSKLIMDGKLYDAERRAGPLEDIIQDMRNKYIMIRRLDAPGEAGTAFRVSFDYPDPAKAQYVTRTLLSRFTGQATFNGNLEVLDPASLPDRPVSPRRSRIVIMGLVLGLAAGTLIFGIGRWPKVALTGLASGVAVLIGTYFFLPDQYMSTAVLRLADEPTGRAIVSAITDRVFLRSVIEEVKLYPGEPADEAVARMRRDLRVQNLQGPRRGRMRAVTISFQYPDKYKVQGVVRAMVTRSMQAAVNPAKPPVQVLDPASLPRQPFEPNRAVLVGLGLLAGVLLGVAWNIRGRFRNPAPRPA
ncbi:MAG TPA: GNVR domain-containing protein [Candidatus Sulfopaludibacter sp.]|nr:GNVR domain-containing protein [Candidatus Sulfopaludibacter sp.]